MTLDSRRAVVSIPIAPLFTEPRVASAQISQVLAGRIVELLDTHNDWRRVRCPDQYEGWMHKGYLAPPPAEEPQRSTRVERISLGCVTTSPSGARRAMPLGALLNTEECVASGEVFDASSRAERFPAVPGAIVRTAQSYFEGTSYLWGGVTPWGADCSGFVQSVYWLHGIQLKRDAFQQAEQGGSGEVDPLRSCAGDLLFFSDRDDRFITHVAIALGASTLVHLALGRGGYAVERMDDDGDSYVRTLLQRFVTSRRILLPGVMER